MIGYAMLIKKGSNGNIASFWFPDLNFEFHSENEDAINTQNFPPRQAFNVTEFSRSKLETLIMDLEAKNYVINKPRKLKDYNTYPINPGDIWTKVYINYNLKKNAFEKSLPVLGHASNVLTAVGNASVTFLAVQLATGTDSNSRVISGLAGSLGLIFNLIIYTYSGMISDMRKFGRILDNRLFRSPNPQTMDVPGLLLDTEKDPKLCCNTTSRMFGYLGFNVLVLANTIASVVTTYQEVDALGARASEKHSYITPEIILTLLIVLSITGAISTYSFETSFVKILVDDIVDKYKRHKSQEAQELPESDNDEKDNSAMTIPLTSTLSYSRL